MSKREYKYVSIDDDSLVSSGIYLIHFDERIGTERQSAGHYVGCAADLHERLDVQLNGKSGAAAIMRHAVKRMGIRTRVVRIWPTSPDKQSLLSLENVLKGKHAGNMFCPICNADYRELKRLGEVVPEYTPESVDTIVNLPF